MTRGLGTAVVDELRALFRRAAPRSRSAPPDTERFARHLEHDLDAVTAGISQPWNSGVVEGHVKRIKMLKRQMFSRAGFELLRKRVLLCS
ncbi:hypothetical protein [Streptomyces sp. NPDC049040]|uniref:hypothetical protein n=1 Tax=Streptomyces sp. NPDC049040 TaxID=3365593 RepID=UPI0037217F77